MFFGLEIKQNQNQSKPIVLDQDLKLSQAVLDPSKNRTKEPVCLMIEHDKKQFILCVLDPTQSWQCPLDLEFKEGSEVKFFLRGSGTVHLTGIKYSDNDYDALSLSMSDSDEQVSDEEDNGELEPVDDEMPKKKRIVDQIPAKRIPTRVSNGKALAKSDLKKVKVGQEDVDDGEEDSSDDDFDVTLADEDSDDEEEEDEMEEDMEEDESDEEESDDE